MTSPPDFTTQPLANHDKASFSSGVPELDRYLQVQAAQDVKRKVAAPFVMVDSNRRILGYYTLSAYGIRLGELPAGVARKLPKYPLMPATLLGRLAVNQADHGKGLGALLLMDALYRSWKNTAEVASIGVVAEAMSDSAGGFYLHHEFAEMPGHAAKLFIGMKTIANAFE